MTTVDVDPSQDASNPLPMRRIDGPDAWVGEELLGNSRWQFRIEEPQNDALWRAVQAARATHTRWQDISAESFHIEAAEPLIQRISDELENGCGLASISGFDIDRYDDEALNWLWFGIGCHLGTPLPQDYRGMLMRDITDERQDTDAMHGHTLTARDGSAFQSSKARTASNGPLRFHTDRADIVGLLCMRAAVSGGVSRIASSVAVHNCILARRPDLARLLYQPYERSRLGEEQGGERATYPLPVFGVRDGKFSSHFSRTYIEAAQELPGVIRLSDAQWEALDVLAEVAFELCMEMTMARGDMQLINNHVIYHARTAYEDGAEARPGAARRMRRIWVSARNSRALPPDHAVLWRNTESGAHRGGIAPSV